MIGIQIDPMATFAYTPRAMKARMFVIYGLSAAILAGCGGPATTTYRLTFDTQDPGDVAMLTTATIRVMQRRLDRLGAELFGQHTEQDADGASVEITASDAGALEELTTEMTAPFDLDVMVATTGSGDVTVEGYGAFSKTGVTGDDIRMVLAKANDDGVGASVNIRFTDDGLAEMRELFANNVGKDLGLFVRGRLVSTLTVKSADLPNPLVIDGIPDAELATIFADDVNVGIHVTVTPL